MNRKVAYEAGLTGTVKKAWGWEFSPVVERFQQGQSTGVSPQLQKKDNKSGLWGGDVAQHLKLLTAFPDMGPIPSTHVTDYSCNSSSRK